MKKLYFIDYEDVEYADRSDVLVLEDTEDLMAQVEKHFRGREYCDDETGELWAKNIRLYPLAAVDADGNEYEIKLNLMETK